MLDRIYRIHPRFLPLLALFLCVLGARLWLVNRYGNALPYWDQWDGEGGELLRPWLDGQLHPADLFIPHAEHRIVPTRLTALALAAITGRWDARREMIFNAALVAAIAVALANLLAGERRRTAAASLGVAALFALPFAWENTLAGFQSQFYYLLGASLLTLWGLGTRPAGSPGWWLGAAGAFGALVCMGSGLLAAMAVGLWTLCRLVPARRGPTGGELATLAVCLAAVALGVWTRVPVPQHAGLRVENAGKFVVALGRCLAWPRVTEPAWGLVMAAPLALLAVAHFARPAAAADPAADRRLLLGTWVALQAAAMAYARGAGDFPPQSRYMDLLGLGALLSALALPGLVARAPAGWRRETAAALAGLWGACLLVGLGGLTEKNFTRDLPERTARQGSGAAAAYRYLATGDRRLLLDGPPDDAHVPYPNVPYLLDLLDHPGIRRLLPDPVGKATHLGDLGGGLFLVGLAGLLPALKRRRQGPAAYP